MRIVRYDATATTRRHAMSPIVIRHCEAADLPQVHALYSEPQAFADTLQLPYQSLVHWQRKLAERDGFVNLVALRDGQLVGQLGLDVQRSPRRRHVATLGMGVAAGARRTGVGSALLDAAIRSCEQWMAVSRIEIEVYTDNAAGIALYRKHGFEIEGTCHRYAFRDGVHVDAHIMARVRGLVTAGGGAVAAPSIPCVVAGAAMDRQAVVDSK